MHGGNSSEFTGYRKGAGATFEEEKRRASENVLSLVILFLGVGMRGAGVLGETRNALVSTIAVNAGVVEEPSSHLRGTAPLTLSKDVAHPVDMTSPRLGSIFVIELRQANQHFLRQIASTPALRDKIWHPGFSSLDAYKKSLQGQRSDLRKMFGLSDLDDKVSKAESLVLESGAVRVEDVTMENLLDDREQRHLPLGRRLRIGNHCLRERVGRGPVHESCGSPRSRPSLHHTFRSDRFSASGRLPNLQIHVEGGTELCAWPWTPKE